MSADTAIQIQGIPEHIAMDLHELIESELSTDLSSILINHDKNTNFIRVETIHPAFAEQLNLPISLPALLSVIGGLNAQTDLVELSLNGRWQLNVKLSQLQCTDKTPIALAEKELSLLMLLMKSPLQAHEKQSLLQQVWDYSEGVDTSTLESHIYRLRQKLEQAGCEQCLQTTEEGYCWQPNAGT